MVQSGLPLMLDLRVSYDMIHLSRCQHLMKHCLSDWVRRTCERARTSVRVVCVLSLSGSEHWAPSKIHVSQFHLSEKNTLLMSGIFDQTINYLVRGSLNTALPEQITSSKDITLLS